jgi:hypothetical protein
VIDQSTIRQTALTEGRIPAPQHFCAVAGNHCLFAGWNDEYFRPAVLSVDQLAAFLTRRIVNTRHSNPPSVFVIAATSPATRNVNSSIASAGRGSALASKTRMSAERAGDAKQSGFLVEQVLEVIVLKIQQHARIDGFAARAHHQSVERVKLMVVSTLLPWRMAQRLAPLPRWAANAGVQTCVGAPSRAMAPIAGRDTLFKKLPAVRIGDRGPRIGHGQRVEMTLCAKRLNRSRGRASRWAIPPMARFDRSSIDHIMAFSPD